jgi:hypothetical protein
VHELEGEELAGADEAAVILVDKVKGEEREEVGEDEVQREVRVGFADEVEPIDFRESGVGAIGSGRGLEESGPAGEHVWPVVRVVRPFFFISNLLVVLRIFYIKRKRRERSNKPSS